MRRGVYAAALAAVVVAGMAWSAAAQARNSNAIRSRSSSYGQVYLLRGLIDVFSQGMDDLGQKLRRRGIDSVTVMNHSAYEALAAQAVAKYRTGNHGPIIIAGHSLGADAAMQMAQLLNEARIPVALVVGFGPTLYLKVPANVARVVNYYQSQGAWNATYAPGPGFHGSLVNVNLDRDPDITHFNIEKNARLQYETIARVMAIMGSRKAATSVNPAILPYSAAAAPANTSASEAN